MNFNCIRRILVVSVIDSRVLQNDLGLVDTAMVGALGNAVRVAAGIGGCTTLIAQGVTGSRFGSRIV